MQICNGFTSASFRRVFSKRMRKQMRGSNSKKLEARSSMLAHLWFSTHASRIASGATAQWTRPNPQVCAT